MSSNVSTPYLEPTTSHTLSPPSPSPLATTSMAASNPSSAPPSSAASASNLDADIPPLSLDILTTQEDKVAALKLIADSIAQQRQQASYHLVFHPLNLAALAALLAVAYQIPKSKDLGTLTVVFCGIIMTYLLSIRYLSGPYIKLAEEFNWSFLLSPDSSEEDVIIGSKFGAEMVGALVLRLEGASSHPKKKGRAGFKGGKGVIRAWTTRLRYRGKGVGGDLLKEAIKITKERCGRDAEVGFAKEHANSRMVLPEMYNGVFRKREMRAARALEGVLGESEGRRKR